MAFEAKHTIGNDYNFNILKKGKGFTYNVSTDKICYYIQRKNENKFN